MHMETVAHHACAGWPYARKVAAQTAFPSVQKDVHVRLGSARLTAPRMNVSARTRKSAMQAQR